MYNQWINVIKSNNIKRILLQNCKFIKKYNKYLNNYYLFYIQLKIIQLLFILYI